MKRSIDTPSGALSLVESTRPLYHAFYRSFEQDPALFADPSQFRPYHYDAAEVDARFDKLQAQQNKKSFLVLLEETVIGELHFKHIDPARKSGALGICLANNTYKNRGFGTLSEQLALQIGFEDLGLSRISAQVLQKNARSQRALEKAGFQLLSEDETYRYYGISKERYRSLL